MDEGMEDLEAADVMGTYKRKEDSGFTYSLLLYQPLGWTGGPSGNFVLTEDGSTCGSLDSRSGTVDYSGRWELKVEEVHLFPESVGEAFWDDEIGEGDWETKYPYKGETPLVARIEDLTEGKVSVFGLRAFGKDLLLERSEK
jgi:hypothetical protein